MSHVDDKKITTDSYRKYARAVADKFNSFPPRIRDIERAFGLCGIERPAVFEIGYGSGRDAKLIVDKANSYVGIDVSPELADIAREAVPGADFRVADVAGFDFPDKLNVIFAFASLLHSDKDELRDVLLRAEKTLVGDGVILLSMKKGRYGREQKEDLFGTRVFYLYNKEDIEDLAPESFKTAYYNEQEIRGQFWFTIILQKKKRCL